MTDVRTDSSAKTGTASSYSTTASAWVYPRFLRDGRLRVRERYWRSLPLESSASSLRTIIRSSSVIVVPDALTWRKYLPVIRALVELQQAKQEQQQRDGSNDNEHNKTTLLSWYLLESVAEYMDYRNQSPTIEIPKTVANSSDDTTTETTNTTRYCREPAAPQERSILQRLVKQQQQHVNVEVFCDVSVCQRMDDSNNNTSGDDDDDADDEWLYLKDMNLQDRSRHAWVRAACMIHDMATTTTTTTNSTNKHRPSVWLLCNDPSSETLILSEKEEEMKYINIRDLIQWVFMKKGHISTSTTATSDQYKTLLELANECERDYVNRIVSSIGNVSPGDDSSIDTLYKSEEDIRQGLKEGRLVKGRFLVTKENAKEAFVSVQGGGGRGDQLYIDGQKGHFGRAIHQDVVIVALLEPAQWGRPVGKRRLVYHNDNAGDEETSSTTKSLQLEDTKTPAIPSGCVIAVDQLTGRRTVVATMVDIPSHDETAILVVPMDIRIPKIRIRTRAWQKFEGVRLKVEIDGWEEGSKYPHGHCVEVLGPIGDLESEISALLLENEIQLDPFSVEARACLPTEGEAWVVSDGDIIGRKDLRQSRRVFSVDPPGCQDIDDTMHAEILPNGDIEGTYRTNYILAFYQSALFCSKLILFPFSVGVHIADVTAFVKHNSALDKEAQVRGTTFYLVDRRFDMLPSLLSSNLCSLHGGMDRLAVSVIWVMSSDLNEVKSCWYGRSVIHNCAGKTPSSAPSCVVRKSLSAVLGLFLMSLFFSSAMTYDQADRILSGLPPEDPSIPDPPPLTAGVPVNRDLIPQLKKDLSILTRLGHKLKSDREEIGGAVDLSSGDLGTELKFTLDKNGNPTKVAPKEDKEIHHTIAEMMIMANSYVATKIYESYSSTALLRVHQAAEEDRLDDLKQVLASKGVILDGSNNTALANSLRAAEQQVKTNAVVKSLFRSLATRAMTEARYVCTGDGAEGADYSHYGLGLQKYTHFTSPIRRYADVIVHKQLLAALEDERCPLAPEPNKPLALEPLSELPESNVVSILAGEGLANSDDHEDDDLIDYLTAGAADLVLGSDSPVSEIAKEESSVRTTREPYLTSEVSSLCEGLNRHNRLAKLSSMECQGLFLSLYFRNHVEVAQAVVLNVRTNGFWVYVPKFDMRGPVYVSAIDGAVQIDPALVGLPPDAGAEATVGFASLRNATRRFTTGTCSLVADGANSTEERLDISIPEGKKVFSARPLDVVTVSISCENWDVRARVPSPRLFLVSNDKCSFGEVSPHPIFSSTIFASEQRESNKSQVEEKLDEELTSMADVLYQIRIPPGVLPSVPCRFTNKKLSTSSKIFFEESIKGRQIYGAFVNPDTRSAIQEAAQEAAAAEATQRRGQLLGALARRREYDTTRTIERNVTMRQQRLAAEKRNTRRSKAK